MSILTRLPARGRLAIVAAMTRASNGVGAYGERRAVEYLVHEAGMVVLARNWRCADGEIDIVARDGSDLVFVEVKTRRDRRFGPPEEAVVVAKRRRLRRLALQWLAESGVRPREIRFDVVSVLRPRRGPAHVEHLRAAF
jgi:putative endonuclease